MSEVANLYDNGPISPIARIMDNIAVWTGKGEWVPYKIHFIEGIPRSSPYIVDMCVVGNQGLPIAANGQVAKSVVVVLQMNDKELCHYRWEPIDDVEGGLWELGAQVRYNPFGGQARTSPMTADGDPYLATTTFWVLGQNKDLNIGAFNQWAVAQPVARFAFFGYRYILSPLPMSALTDNSTKLTYIPAMGR